MTKRKAQRPKAANRRAATAEPDERFGRFCIGCGCCDTIGCEAGCSWREVHPSVHVGVCSECPAYLPLLKRMTVAIAEAIHAEKLRQASEWL